MLSLFNGIDPHRLFLVGGMLHDTVYSRELLISNKENGYRDIIASSDLSTYRRIPWENNVPFFLVSFLDPETLKPLSVCPRGTLNRGVERGSQLWVGVSCMGSNMRWVPACQVARGSQCSVCSQYFQFKGWSFSPSLRSLLSAYQRLPSLRPQRDSSNLQTLTPGSELARTNPVEVFNLCQSAWIFFVADYSEPGLFSRFI